MFDLREEHFFASDLPRSLPRLQLGAIRLSTALESTFGRTLEDPLFRMRWQMNADSDEAGSLFRIVTMVLMT
jgi:hypothetical protein